MFHNRYFLVLLTGAMMAGLYWAYCQVVIPQTIARAEPVTPAVSSEAGFQPPVFAEVAETHFADTSWTKSATLKWQRGENSFLYSNSIERVNDGGGNTVLMKPLAILWRDPRRPEAPPYRLIADAARIQFENSFFDSAIDIADSNPGRIVWASLEGQVLIDGPDSLHIAGSHFIFSEESAHLYSDYAVRFAYGPTEDEPTRILGSAEQLDITLLHAEESILGDDMPLIGGVAAFMLRRNVTLDLTFEQDGELSNGRITSAGPFEYDVMTRTATFEDAVHVAVQSRDDDGKPGLDRLVCNWLGLEFAQVDEDGQPVDLSGAVPDDEGQDLEPAGMFDGLALHRLRAVGTTGRTSPQRQQAIVESERYDVVANMQDLTYDALRRVAVLIDDEAVVIQREGTRFLCPQVRFEHTEDGDLVSLHCRGAGRLSQHDDATGRDLFHASWGGSVDVRVDEDGSHLIHLRRATQLTRPDEFQLAADQIMLWVDVEAATEIDADNLLAGGELPLRRARAEGSVRLVSPRVVVKHADAVHVKIVPGDLPDQKDDSTGIAQVGGESSADTVEPPWTLEAGQLDVMLVHDAESERVDVRQIDGDGNIQIVQESERRSSVRGFELGGTIRLAGRHLKALNFGENRQTLQLSGAIDSNNATQSPATFQVGDFSISGATLVVDRAANRADVIGPGSLQFPIATDLDGKPLKEPSLLGIAWREQMNFDGQTITFFGQVRASLQDPQKNVSRMQAEEMNVALNRRVELNETGGDHEKLDIERVECRFDVRIEAYEYSGPQIIGIRRGSLAQFSLERSSGDFIGTGPGEFNDWRLGNSVAIAPRVSAHANRPAEAAKPEWRYTHVAFAGSMAGNIYRRQAELEDRVSMLSAPVAKALEVFRRDDLSLPGDQAANAAWLGCERLRLTRRHIDELDRDFHEILAHGSTELEGQMFRAVADEVSFEEQYERFLLRGHGREARLYFQENPGKEERPTAARLIEFIPSRRSVTVDGSTGVSSGL